MVFNFGSVLAVAGGLFAAVLALGAFFRKRRSLANVCFAAGMIALCLKSGFDALALGALSADEAARWQMLALGAGVLLPGLWLSFSLSYSRGNYREFFSRWRYILALAAVAPAGIFLGWGNVKALNICLLLAFVLVLMNLEKTLRTSVGTMRWRIKFMVLGLAVIFGTLIYTRSQALLFSGMDAAPASTDAVALLVGCMLVTVAYWRTGFEEIEIYPSRAVLQGSVTVLLVGAYLVVVGVLAQVVALFGGAESFYLQALFVLVAVAALGVLVLSARFRQLLQDGITRHFARPHHDFRAVWRMFTRRISQARDQTSLCCATAEVMSETFEALSVSVWLIDEHGEHSSLVATTSQIQKKAGVDRLGRLTNADIVDACAEKGPFDLDRCDEPWAERIRGLSPTQFSRGGSRICLPLSGAGDQPVGVVILADRARALPYTLESLDLLKCIGDQAAAGLLNLRLTGELLQAQQLEAFQAMSTFFVHDLKNAAHGLNLTMINLPEHFDNPAFREDALRGIAHTTRRINEIVGRLNTLRSKLEIHPREMDLNEVVQDAIHELGATGAVEIETNLSPVSTVLIDPGHFKTVVINLLFNAREAVSRSGSIRVETSGHNGHVTLSVSDNGCGMSAEFLRDSLFRPFQTTKKKGMGIGLFHSRALVEAHRGRIDVESEPGQGTTFKISLPVSTAARKNLSSDPLPTAK